MYPETKGVPLEEMDIVFGEGTLSVIELCSFIWFDIGGGGEGANKHAKYSSSGSWFKRLFIKDGSGSANNRTRSTRESYTPLREDHDFDHDDDHVEVRDQEEDDDDGEDYEMITRSSPDHEH